MLEMKGYKSISMEEANLICGGEAITLTIVLTYLAISILTVVVWKLFTSGKAKVSLPGGALFEWSETYMNNFPSLLK